MSVWRYAGFGLELRCDFPLLPVEFPDASGRAVPIICTEADYTELAAEPAQDWGLVWETQFNNRAYQTLSDGMGTYTFVWQGRAAFRLCGQRLSCGFAHPNDVGSRRLLLDTVLWSISLLNGFECLHASAISFDGRALAFVATTGGGKTSLAAEFLRTGAHLLADDVVALGEQDARMLAHPAPAVANLPLSALEEPPPGSLQLGVFEDEAWIAIDQPSALASPLDAVFVLERGDFEHADVRLHPHGTLALLPHAFGFPGERGRLAAQLNALADLTVEAPVLQLRVPAELAPSATANLVLSALPALAPAACPQ